MDSVAELFGRVYEKGEVVFRQGDPGREMYIIQSGVVEVARMRGNRKVVLTLLEKGDFFGEIALLDQRPRSATVSAVTRTRLLPLSRGAFLKNAAYNPPIVLFLLKAISRRIDRMTRQVRDAVATDVELREQVMSGRNRAQADRKSMVSGISDRKDIRPDALFCDTPNVPLPEQVRSFSAAQAPRGQSCDAGHLVFEEGQKGEWMYFIIEGEVEIFQEVREGRCPLARLGPGDYFGEMAVITGEPRSASAAACTPLKLQLISRDEMRAAVETDPETGLFFLQILIGRLRTITRALEDPQRSLRTLRRTLVPRLNKKKKAAVGISSLSSCGGCAAAFVQNSDALDSILEEAKIRYCPMLMDRETIREVQIAVVDGAVRTREDEDKLREIRRKSRFLVAWGTCAAFGGIPALANDFELEELLEESYGHTLDLFSYYLADGRPEKITEDYGIEAHLLRQTRRISDTVKVDYYLPGCPPPIELIYNLLLELQGRAPAAAARIVCADCSRKPAKGSPGEVKSFPLGEKNDGDCFLSRGILCLGILTRGGCWAECTGGGLPCWGCRGPANSVIGRMNGGEGFEEAMCRLVSRRMKKEPQELALPLRVLRQRCGSALSFEHHFIRDASRIR